MGRPKVPAETMAAPALKTPREIGGILTLFSNPKVYPTNFMPFFFDNFFRLLGFGGTSSFQSPPVAPPLSRKQSSAVTWSILGPSLNCVRKHKRPALLKLCLCFLLVGAVCKAAKGY